MAPVPIEPPVKYTGAVLVTLHVLGIIYCTQQAVSSLYRSYKSLSPSQDVRLRLSRRKRLVPLFSSLAVLSLVIACYAGWGYASLSYGVWADERGIGVSSSDVQDGLTTNASVIQPEPHSYQFVFDRIRWLGDTPVYQDAFEIVAEKARRFWWGQQLDLALIPWTVLVAAEGSRRGITNLIAFQFLAHLVNLSFAQNLFFVALLLTPSPLPEQTTVTSRIQRIRNAIFPLKPRGWALNPGVLLLNVLTSYLAIYLLPYAAGTPSFNRVLFTSKALTFVPLVLQNIAPASWGTVAPGREAGAEPAFVDLFRFVAVLSAVLHGVATFSGLRFNVPHAHYHRHSRLLPWDIEERSRWERTTSAIGKLLGATRDHPVVVAVGYDVLVAALSTGLWAAVRSLEATDILTATVPLYDKSSHAKEVDVSGQNDDEEHYDENSAAAIIRRRAAKSRRTKSDGNQELRGPPTPRRRGRPRKARQDPEEEPGDSTYQPTLEEKISAQGDNIPIQEVDLEAAGLAWGLMAIGGLGCGSAGVFGGECLAR